MRGWGEFASLLSESLEFKEEIKQMQIYRHGNVPDRDKETRT